MSDPASLVAAASISQPVPGSEPHSLAEISRALLPGEALLDVQVIDFRDGNVVVFLVLPQQDTVARVVRIDGKVLRAKVDAWQRCRGRWLTIMKILAKHPGAPKTNKTPSVLRQELTDCWRLERQALKALGTLLLGGFLKDLEQAGVTTLIVSPDGLLHRIPLAALRIPDGPTGATCDMIDRFALQLIPTASSLAILRRAGNTGMEWAPKLLAAAPFGDAASPLSDAASFIPKMIPPVTDADDEAFAGLVLRDVVPDGARLTLPASDNEIEEIAGILRSVAGSQREPVVLHQEQATRQALIEQIPGANILHLSTHGSNLEPHDTIMRYRIHLAAGASIQVREIYDDEISLAHVWLVSLSACHLGEVVLRGTEALGFSQAFLEAGVRVVLVPIWAVDDAASAVLMTTWYRHLAAELRPDVAHAWQRAVLETKQVERWRHPFFWAGFLPIGDGALRFSAPATAQ